MMPGNQTPPLAVAYSMTSLMQLEIHRKYGFWNVGDVLGYACGWISSTMGKWIEYNFLYCWLWAFCPAGGLGGCNRVESNRRESRWECGLTGNQLIEQEHTALKFSQKRNRFESQKCHLWPHGNETGCSGNTYTKVCALLLLWALILPWVKQMRIDGRDKHENPIFIQRVVPFREF